MTSIKDQKKMAVGFLLMARHRGNGAWRSHKTLTHEGLGGEP